MYIKEINDKNEIIVALPITQTKGKLRVKKRSILNEYGIPVATCQTELSQSCYVEWQISYDLPIADKEKLNLTKLKDKVFTGANGKIKALYELSEYIFYLYKLKYITIKELKDIKNFIETIPNENLLDMNPGLSIKRSNFIEMEYNNIPFLQTRLEYPLIVHHFGKYEIITEIVIREKQRAVGVMPMLYLCFPITELKTDEILIGRKAKSKEIAEFVINQDNCEVFTQLMKLFGMLSKNHKKDILSIIDLIINS